ncbi:hypothetical protein RERY_58840 [Rhodococcus erythropolis]|nr:hypothetical protein RERY_58840 [Rhodococcus erythropolis]
MIETAASVGPYTLCKPAEDTRANARTVSSGNASPITNTSLSDTNACSGTDVAKTVNIDGTKSVNVTR